MARKTIILEIKTKQAPVVSYPYTDSVLYQRLEYWASTETEWAPLAENRPRIRPVGLLSIININEPRTNIINYLYAMGEIKTLLVPL